MKKLITYIMLLIVSTIIAQNQTAKDSVFVNLIGRKVAKTNSLQFRFFLPNQSVLKQYVKNGAVLERVSNPNSNTFTVVKNLKPLANGDIDALMTTANNKDKEELAIAKGFLNELQKENGVTLSEEELLKNIVEAKENNEFKHALVLLQILQNKKVAKAFGVDFTVVNINKNDTYRVRILGENSLYTVISNSFKLGMYKTDQKPTIETTIGDTELSFSWKKPNLSTGAVEVERKLANGDFKLLTKNPEYNIANADVSTFRDNNLKNYTKYTYRFYTYNIFGDRDLIGEVTAMPKDLTPPKKPLIQMPKHNKPNEVTVSWSMNEPVANDLKGFIVLRGKENQGKYQLIHKKILHKSVRKYIDKSFKKDGSNYYIVQAIDTANNISTSLPAYVTLVDSIPPAKPKFISAKMDSLGIVTINIEKGKEKDLMGYRLFRSNANYHEFSAIQENFREKDTVLKPVQTIFKDTVTLNSLTPYVYYRAKALDFNHNQSPYSEIIKVKRLDTIPPITPVFKNVTVTGKGVQLLFALSNEEDVVQHELYRKQQKDAVWQTIKTFSKRDSTFTDNSVKKGVFYQYTIRSKDDSNLYSKYAIPVTVKGLDTGIREGVTNLKITEKKEVIELSWQYATTENPPLFIIYKSDTKGRLREFKTTRETKFNLPKTNDKSKYAVRVLTQDGGKSKISEVTSL